MCVYKHTETIESVKKYPTLKKKKKKKLNQQITREFLEFTMRNFQDIHLYMNTNI